MRELSELVDSIEKEFHIDLEIISGGNSANYEWYKFDQDIGKINNLRLGESILLGCETVNREAIPDLHTHAFNSLPKLLSPRKNRLFHLEKFVRMLLETCPPFKTEESTSE